MPFGATLPFDILGFTRDFDSCEFSGDGFPIDLHSIVTLIEVGLNSHLPHRPRDLVQPRIFAAAEKRARQEPYFVGRSSLSIIPNQSSRSKKGRSFASFPDKS